MRDVRAGAKDDGDAGGGLMDKSGPAYPVSGTQLKEPNPGQIQTWVEVESVGLTKREWFAGQALAECQHRTRLRGGAGLMVGGFDADLIAKEAFIIADSMIAESSK